GVDVLLGGAGAGDDGLHLLQAGAPADLDLATLEREIGRVREHGWAQLAGEREEDLNAVAVPVLDSSATLVAVLGVQGAASTCTSVRMAGGATAALATIDCSSPPAAAIVSRNISAQAAIASSRAMSAPRRAPEPTRSGARKAATATSRAPTGHPVRAAITAPPATASATRNASRSMRGADRWGRGMSSVRPPRPAATNSKPNPARAPRRMATRVTLPTSRRVG
ncbi:MAG: hypothetical protein KY439_10425, partial [Actinobacteria bacterium]|nr:hypothetical protein [Actinomycetota bacterium]